MLASAYHVPSTLGVLAHLILTTSLSWKYQYYLSQPFSKKETSKCYTIYKWLNLNLEKSPYS